ncbi:MAG: hypothetical protein IJ640_00740 [Prevotella sp.]|nr:hypothetical protein [Prevotella sp.]
MTRIYLPTEKVPKNRYFYGLYAKDGKDHLVITLMRCEDAAVFGDIVNENTELIPIGFVLASDMMKLLKDNLQVNLSSLAAIGRTQAMWHTPSKKE